MEINRLYSVLGDCLNEQKREDRAAAGEKASHAGGKVRKDAQEGTEGPWVVEDKCTLADLVCFSWVN
jgi:hypothetical protein